MCESKTASTSPQALRSHTYINGCKTCRSMCCSTTPRSREPVTLEDLNFDRIREQFEVNAPGALQFTHTLLLNLNAGSKVVMMTSRMGSIEDNTSDSSYGYRMSKVALSMAGKSLSHDHHCYRNFNLQRQHCRILRKLQTRAAADSSYDKGDAPSGSQLRVEPALPSRKLTD